MELFDRKVVVRFLGGSHMRNLNDENSDDDLKYFVLPTREDLFTSNVFTKFESTEELDTDVQDVRRLENLFYKSNPAYLDLLFSPDIKEFGYESITELLSMKDAIARMNLPYLYSASMGMFNQNTKDLTRPTSDKVKAMIESHGYNTKKFMMAMHFAYSIERFWQSEFTDYQNAIWYEGERRERMMQFKHGALSLAEATEVLTEAEHDMQILRASYSIQPFEKETFEKLQKLLRELVYTSL